MARDEDTVREIQREYSRSDVPWYLAYSGGKDSSALLKLLFRALSEIDHRPNPVTVIYCDTGVEIPPMRRLARRTLRAISLEAAQRGLPLRTKMVWPKLRDRYFVKIIGRGYPPPSNKFRWCTRRLLTNPVKNAMASAEEDASVLMLGMRRGESAERNKTMVRHHVRKHYFRHSRNARTLIYSPIIDYSDEDVWTTLAADSLPVGLPADRLAELYGQADVAGSPSDVRSPLRRRQGRFGCWACSVVRKDVALQNLVSAGHRRLAPLLSFRNWLVGIRDDPECRCTRRRNGVAGLGPFTLDARRKILDRLLAAQTSARMRLLPQREVAAISKLWAEDENSPSYPENYHPHRA